MLIELLVLIGCLLWACLCLLGNTAQSILRMVIAFVWGLFSLLTLGLLRFIRDLTMGVGYLVKVVVVGLYRTVVMLTWTVPRFVLATLWVVLCHIVLCLWRGVCGSLPYIVLLCVGFLAVHLVVLVYRSPSISAVLRTLNLTPPSRACPF